MINPKLELYIKRRINEATVILSFRILLENCIKNGLDATMTKTEIEIEFNKVHMLYGISTFRRDYVLRQCGKDDNAIDQHQNNFFIKETFLEGMKIEDLEEVLNQINRYWNNFQDEQKHILEEIENILMSKNPDEKEAFIIDMLCNRETVRRGQSFEVTSFSILKSYLNALGFELNRFSTTFSNDGGIDFAAQNAVYQVTTRLSANKFAEDIKKVPGKLRILVYKETVRDFDISNFEHDLVLNHINSQELCKYLSYLKEKYSLRYINKILEVMLSEFTREFYQN